MTYFHGLANFNVPIAKQILRTVLTIHDIIPLIAKGEVSRSSNLQLSILLKLVFPSRTKLLCVSSWTKDSFDSYFPNYDLSSKDDCDRMAFRH